VCSTADSVTVADILTAAEEEEMKKKNEETRSDCFCMLASR
jgi:hypothetical protein